MINQFALAISLKQTDDFLLGREAYFYLDRDWGVHDPTTTGMILADYGTQFGCDEMRNRVNEAFANVVKKDDLTINDIQNLLGIIFFWKSYREHKGDLMCEWELPKDTSITLISSYENVRNPSGSQVANSLIERLRVRFNWP